MPRKQKQATHSPLRTARKKAGITLSDLADAITKKGKIRVTQGWLSRVERGYPPSLELAAALSAELRKRGASIAEVEILYPERFMRPEQPRQAA